MITLYQSDMHTLDAIKFGYDWGFSDSGARVVIVPDDDWDSVKDKLSSIASHISEIESPQDLLTLHMSRSVCLSSSTHEFADVCYRKASNLIIK